MAVVVKHKKTATFADQPGVEINRGEWNDSHDITGLAAVATSGAYSDLTGKPTLGTLAGLNAVDLTANVTGILPFANGGSNNNATLGAGQIVYSDGTKYTGDANLTWSATTGLLTKKGISSKGSANGIGTELFGLGAYDNGTSATTNNTVIGAGAGITQTYSTTCTVIGQGSTGINFSTVIGGGSTDTGSGGVVIGYNLSNSSQSAIVIGSGCSASSGGLLAAGLACAAGTQDSGVLGWGGSAQQSGELTWGSRQTTSLATSFRLFGCTSSAFTGADMFRINTAWIDPTNATRKARAILSTYDTAEREFMRADATGSGVNAFIKDKLRVGDVTTTATAVVHLSAGTSAAATAPLKFTVPGVPLTTPEAGAMETDAERIYYTPTSLIRCCLAGTIFTQTADKTVSNTVTETSVVGTGVGYGLTLPANFFIIGKTVRLRIGGIYSTPALATPSVTVKVKYGTVVLASVTTSSLLSGAANLEFDGEIDITCRSTGGSGTVAMHGDIEYATGVAGTIAVDPLNNVGAVKTIDTTAASLLDVTVTWDTATSTRIATSTVCTVEVLN